MKQTLVRVAYISTNAAHASDMREPARKSLCEKLAALTPDEYRVLEDACDYIFVEGRQMPERLGLPTKFVDLMQWYADVGEERSR